MEFLWSSAHHTFWWIPFPNSLRALQVGQGHVAEDLEVVEKELEAAGSHTVTASIWSPLAAKKQEKPSLTYLNLYFIVRGAWRACLCGAYIWFRKQKVTEKHHYHPHTRHRSIQPETHTQSLSLSLPLSLPPRNSAKWKAKPSLQENQTKAMCLEPSLCPDRHREFARANKFQSQRISAESSLQPVLLRPAPHFPASSCCSNRGKEASHYNDTFDSVAKSTWGGAKERSSALSWKKQTLWGGILEILLLVNLNGWAPTQRSTWAAIPRESREQAPPGFSCSRACPPFPILSGIQSICIEEWPSLSMLGLPLKTTLAAEFQPDTLHLPCPNQPCFRALLLSTGLSLGRPIT